MIPLEDEFDDSLFIKSNQYSELALQSTTTTEYSDSGFESSSTCSKRDGEFLTPDDLDEPIESASFVGSCDYRHLSIDSSKDSGILGDASNSALTPFSNCVDSCDMKKSLNMPASTTQAIPNKPKVDNLHSTKTADTNCSDAEKHSRRRQLKHQSAAERLQKGTYYVHDNTASYVFPGAQVSWGTDSEDEDNLEDYDDNHCNEDDDTNHAPLSPLMTPSVENEMVKAIASTNGPAQQTSCLINNLTNNNLSNSGFSQTKMPQQHPQPAQKKRQSNDIPDKVTHDFPSKSFSTEANYHNNEDECRRNSPPPHKKRRDSGEQRIFCTTSRNFSLESS